ncbi:MAG: STAS domain-containing protein [Candidatus Promineofilum sp.]|nr:STAS domain-containing protein [Promineifilum sp.]
MEIGTYPIADPVPVQVMTLSGELDASNYLDVIERVRQLYEGGTRQLVIDLSNVSFLSSSGLVALHSAALVMRGDEPPSPDLGWSAFHAIASDVEQEGFETCCTLVNPQSRVRKSLEMTGFSAFLHIYDDVDTAVQAFASNV